MAKQRNRENKVVTNIVKLQVIICHYFKHKRTLVQEQS